MNVACNGTEGYIFLLVALAELLSVRAKIVRSNYLAEMRGPTRRRVWS